MNKGHVSGTERLVIMESILINEMVVIWIESLPILHFMAGKFITSLIDWSSWKQINKHWQQHGKGSRKQQQRGNREVMLME